MGPFETFSMKPLTIFCLQNFILIAGAETRRTFAKDEERKYPGNAHPGIVACLHLSCFIENRMKVVIKLTHHRCQRSAAYISNIVFLQHWTGCKQPFTCAVYCLMFLSTVPWCLRFHSNLCATGIVKLNMRCVSLHHPVVSNCRRRI